MNRTLALALVTAATAGLALAAPYSQAQDYPNRRITIVVPFPAGGTTDTMMRIYDKRWSDAVKAVGFKAE